MSLIDTSSLVDKVYNYLLNELINGRIRYGDILNIKQLADLLKISTMPVREAIKRLEYEHIVEVRPRSGCQVKVPTKKMIMEVYELREVIELYALNKAAAEIDKERLKGLKSVINNMKAVVKIRDVKNREEQARLLDIQFHREICRFAESDYINSVFDRMIILVNMSLIHERTYHSLETQWYDSHADILKCLESNPKEAAPALQKHFRNVKELIFGEKKEGR